MKIGWTIAALVAAIWAYNFFAPASWRGSYSPPILNGDTATVVASNGAFSCGHTPEALDELLKWSTRGDQDEWRRTLITTGSTPLRPGTQVKVLDDGFGKRKVRILSGVSADVECWTVTEALSKP